MRNIILHLIVGFLQGFKGDIAEWVGSIFDSNSVHWRGKKSEEIRMVEAWQ